MKTMYAIMCALVLGLVGCALEPATDVDVSESELGSRIVDQSHNVLRPLRLGQDQVPSVQVVQVWGNRRPGSFVPTSWRCSVTNTQTTCVSTDGNTHGMWSHSRVTCGDGSSDWVLSYAVGGTRLSDLYVRGFPAGEWHVNSRARCLVKGTPDVLAALMQGNGDQARLVY